MTKYLRQLGFLLYAFILRWPIWLLIRIVGRSGIFKTLFLIYPTDNSECLDFCPNVKWLRNFLSGRPTPAGLIMDRWRPIGIYLVIPNPALELMRKKNRPMIKNIIRQMLWVQKLSGAQTIGLAGQLGPIFEKRHGIPMDPPFYSSTYGNIFSIQKAIEHLVGMSTKKAWQTSVSIVGGGLLGEQLSKHLGKDGYRMSMVDVRYTRKGGVKLIDAEQAQGHLCSVDVVINLLPRGIDFMECDLPSHIPHTATIIDFSRPPLPVNALTQRVVMGNRVQKSGIHFFMRLPGGWKTHELPACSMPSLLSALSGIPLRSIDEFRLAARQFKFYTALRTAPVQQYKTVDSIIQVLTSIQKSTARFMLFLTKHRRIFSR